MPMQSDRHRMRWKAVSARQSWTRASADVRRPGCAPSAQDADEDDPEGVPEPLEVAVLLEEPLLDPPPDVPAAEPLGDEDVVPAAPPASFPVADAVVAPLLPELLPDRESVR